MGMDIRVCGSVCVLMCLFVCAVRAVEPSPPVPGEGVCLIDTPAPHDQTLTREIVRITCIMLNGIAPHQHRIISHLQHKAEVTSGLLVRLGVIPSVRQYLP